MYYKNRFPIYDTLMGIRGELNVILKLNFVTDDNPFKESSAGVSFFSASTVDCRLLSVECVYGYCFYIPTINYFNTPN